MDATEFVKPPCSNFIPPQQLAYCPQLSIPFMVVSAIPYVGAQMPWEQEQRRLFRIGRHRDALRLKPVVKVCQAYKCGSLSIKQFYDAPDRTLFNTCVHHENPSAERCVEHEDFAEKFHAAKVARTSSSEKQFLLLIRHNIAKNKSWQTITEEYQTYQCVKELLCVLGKIKGE